MPLPEPLPLEFREEDIGQLLKRRVEPGGSCSIVGIGSIGKSNFVRSLIDPAVLAYHADPERGNLPPEGGPYFLLLIDPHLELPVPKKRDDSEVLQMWAGFEHIFNTLWLEIDLMRQQWMMQYSDPDLTPAEKEGKLANTPLGVLVRRFDALRDELRNGNDPLYATLAMRQLEYALKLLLYVYPEARVVVMFDEFEKMLDRMPPRFFQALRGLRDMFKYSLLYITFSRDEIGELMEARKLDKRDYEDFTELFSTHYLGFYNERDTNIMIDRLLKRHGEKWLDTDPRRKTILQISGGHAGLLGAVFEFRARLGSDADEEKLLADLVTAESVRKECLTIWRGLSDLERTVLLSISRDDTYDTERHDTVATRLKNKGLVNYRRRRYEVIPRLLDLFLEQASAETLRVV